MRHPGELEREQDLRFKLCSPVPSDPRRGLLSIFSAVTWDRAKNAQIGVMLLVPDVQSATTLTEDLT